MSKEAFIDFILKGPSESPNASQAAAESALPDGFDIAPTQPPPTQAGWSFARRLLEASGFGEAEMIQRDNLIRSSDAVAPYLPDRVYFWPQTPSRKYYTLLFETDLNPRQLLNIPAFKARKMAHLDSIEGALARLVNEALDGFQRGGEGVGAELRKGRKEETLCIVSILDEREGEPVRLVCFGTWNKSPDGGLETFQISEQTRNWDPQLAREHLGLLYERKFKKLGGQDWQEAFTTTEERKQAHKLLDVCARRAPKECDIQESVLGLLDTMAKGFGLSKAPNGRRLQAFTLPADHDIGIDPEERESRFGGKNPFGGVTLRDERSRLLGYIVYPLKTKASAALLRKHLKANNRFHNLLVVYPEEDQARLELWRGRERLTGKLRKGQGYKDAADIVNLLSRFFVLSKAKVKNPSELAQELAYRARCLHRLALAQLKEESEKGPLRTLYAEFKKALVHERREDEFASDFAQTLSYGLLTARWVLGAQGAASGERCSRRAMMRRLSLGSRFLGEIFEAVLAMRLEDRARLLWLVDDIADLLDRVDLIAVFKSEGLDLASDPLIHFYEPFLQAYDAGIRVQRGVYYTPRPVVSYIVRSVHELLQTELGLADGLADTTTWGEMLKKHPGLELPLLSDEPGEKRSISPDEPFVQILDPATGTATFLVEVIELIHGTLVSKWKQQRLSDAQQRAAWNDYVPRHLLPRLHAFELMMAPYAIAHMKIGLKLAETGYRFGSEERARIYLTNALEPWVKQPPIIGFEALAHEAAAVNEIKGYKRFTVIIGNPPYSGISSNMSEDAQRIVDAYRVVDGAALNEKKHWLQDDYVKFIRKAQTSIESARVGVFGFISNHGYLNNPTFRGMRQSLMETYQQISLLDLHGNANKKEESPDGSEDKNVFDIRQGVAICLATRGGANAGIQHANLWGSRESKYAWLIKHQAGNTSFSALRPDSPYYFFEPRNTDCRAEYATAWKINEAMPVNSAGFITARDHFVVDFDKDALLSRMADFANPRLSDSEIRAKFFEGRGSAKYPDGDTRGWKVPSARRHVQSDKNWRDHVRRCLYRPFDERHIYWADWMVDWPRPELRRHLDIGGNKALITTRITQDTFSVFVSRLAPAHKSVSAYDVNYVFPLITAPSRGAQRSLLFSDGKEHPNFAPAFLSAFARALRPAQGDDGLPRALRPEDIFHYAYAVFHSPGYRSRYAEFLKIDFPRLPLTGNLELFHALARHGGELSALHLLESPKLAQPITELIGGRHPKVEKISWSRNTVWMDKAQTTGFRGVPEEVWNFHIGGYQVCEKWLKDRKGRTLFEDDIEHYQKIVVALSETIRLMREIDKVIEEHGGWPGAFVTKEVGCYLALGESPYTTR